MLYIYIHIYIYIYIYKYYMLYIHPQNNQNFPPLFHFQTENSRHVLFVTKKTPPMVECKDPVLILNSISTILNKKKETNLYKKTDTL